MIPKPLVLCGAALIVASCAAGPGASPSALPSPAALPSLEATSAATVTAEPTITPTITPGPSTGRILFDSIALTGTSFSVYLMNADGSGVTKLTGTRSAGSPAWSPDGKRVAFQGDDGTWVMNADGSNAKRLSDKGSNGPAWSPDGQMIAFVSTPPCAPCAAGIPWTLSVMNADGSGLRKVTDTQSQERPAWSPDGRSILFAGPPGGGALVGSPALGLWSIRPDGSGARQLTNGFDSWPAWSPDGRRIAFLRTVATLADGSNDLRLFIANADGSSPTKVSLPFAVENGPAWSPDGAWIALGSRSTPTDHRWNIWIVRADATGAVDLTNTLDQAEGDPAWH
jgi:TolB protein